LVEVGPRAGREWAELSSERGGSTLGRRGALGRGYGALGRWLGVGGLDLGPLEFCLGLADGGEAGQFVTVRAAGDESVGGRLRLLGCLGAEEALHRVGEFSVFVASLCPLRGEVESVIG